MSIVSFNYIVKQKNGKGLVGALVLTINHHSNAAGTEKRFQPQSVEELLKICRNGNSNLNIPQGEML